MSRNSEHVVKSTIYFWADSNWVEVARLWDWWKQKHLDLQWLACLDASSDHSENQLPEFQKWRGRRHSWESGNSETGEKGRPKPNQRSWPGYTTKDRSWWFMEHDFLAFWQPWDPFVAYHQDAQSLPTPGPTPLVSVAWVQHGVLMALVPRPKLGLPVGIPGPPVGSPPVGSPPPAPPAPAPARDLGGGRNLYGLKTSKKTSFFFSDPSFPHHCIWHIQRLWERTLNGLSDFLFFLSFFFPRFKCCSYFKRSTNI